MFLMTSLAVFAAGCSGGAPYVYDTSEFDRDSSTFLEGINDRKQFTVCYSKRASNPQDIARLAVNECAKYGKTAQFSKQSYNKCPLLTPVAAIYNCVNTNVSRNFLGKLN